MKRFTRFCIKLIIVLIALCIIAVGAFYYLVPGIHLSTPAQIGLSKTNAVWMAHKWVGEPHTREEIHSILSTLINNNISLVFLHTGPIDRDGTIPSSRYIHARTFLETAKEIAPDITFHAWIGQVRDKLALEDPLTIANIAETSVHLVKNIGFDGIHLNIEPMQSDPVFAMILQNIYTVINTLEGELKREVEVSAAISPIVPELPLKLLKIGDAESFFGHDLDKTYNSYTYVKQLAQYADYLVLMGYDTSFQDTETYEWFIEQELIFLTHAAPRKALLGIPSYEDERPNFNPEIENIETALKGVHRGISNMRSDLDDLSGLAIYSRWTTDDSEWETWKEKWLQHN